MLLGHPVAWAAAGAVIVTAHQQLTLCFCLVKKVLALRPNHLLPPLFPPIFAKIHRPHLSKPNEHRAFVLDPTINQSITATMATPPDDTEMSAVSSEESLTTQLDQLIADVKRLRDGIQRNKEASLAQASSQQEMLNAMISHQEAQQKKLEATQKKLREFALTSTKEVAELTPSDE